MVLLALAACGGPDEATLVDELRVMAVVVEPPEAAPGTTASVTVTVADPLGQAPEVVAWTCTDLGDGCLEAAEPGQGTATGALVDGQLATSRLVSPGLAAVVSDGDTVLPLPLWALACAPGLCPVIDLAAAAPEPDSADADTLAAFLSDPIAGMETLPLTGTSLALGFVRVSARAAPLRNPVITPAFDSVELDAGSSVALSFQVDAPGLAFGYGYTTGGGFEMAEYEVVEGEVTLTLFAPEEAGNYDLWMVVTGDEGGSALWRGVATIR